MLKLKSFYTLKLSISIACILCVIGMAGCVTQEQIDASNQFAFHMGSIGGRFVGRATYVGSMFMNDEGKRFHVHGNWCGAGYPSDEDLRDKVSLSVNRSGHIIAAVRPELLPIDSVDLACARHDVCYVSADRTGQKGARGDCDVILMCDLQNLPDVGNPEIIKPTATVLAWAGGAVWRYLSSDCDKLGYRAIKKTQFVNAGS